MRPDDWAIIQNMFHQALEIESPKAREAFLEGVDLDNSLIGEIRKLLAAHYDSDGFLENAPLDPWIQNEATESEYEPKDRIGHYQLVRELGRGGMGQVFEAIQEEPIQRRVALKILSVDAATPELTARFHREYHILAQLRNRYIAQVYDAGTTEEGLPFFAMELVEGQDIKTYVQKNCLNREKCLELAIQVAEGVQFAHQKGILHRDIKPSNILVQSEGSQPVCKIIDFGIAKQLFHQPETDTPLQNKDGDPLYTAGLLGSPHYLPPEQLTDPGSIPDARSDIYSYGVTLFELMTGEPPFSGQTSLQILENKIHQTVDPPHKTLHGMPVDLSLVIKQCMNRNLEGRPASMADVIEDLKRIQQGRPVQLVDLGFWYAFKLHVRRHRWVAISTFVFLIALAVVGATLLRTRSQARQTELLVQELGTRVERVEWQRRVIHMMPPHNIESSEAVLNKEIVEIEELGRNYGELAFGPKFFAMGKIALTLRQWDKAREFLELARDSHANPAGINIALGRTYAELYWARLEEIEQLPHSAREPLIERANKELKNKALDFLGQTQDKEALFYTGLLFELQGLDALAIQQYQNAFQLQPWLYEALIREIAIRIKQGTQFLNEGEHDRFEALRLHVEQLFTKLQQLAPNDPESYSSLASYLQIDIELTIRKGEHPDEKHKELIDACRRALLIDPDHYQALTQMASELWSFAEFCWYRDGKDPSLKIEEALAIAQHAQSLKTGRTNHHFISAQAYCTLGYFHTEQGANAMVSFQNAIKHTKAILEKFPEDFRSLHQMGLIYWMIADYLMTIGENPTDALIQSETYYKKAIALKPGLSIFFNNLALVFDSRSDYEIWTGQNPVESIELADANYKEAIDIDAYRLAFGNIANLYLKQASFYLEVKHLDLELVKKYLEQAREAIHQLDEVNHQDSELEVSRINLSIIEALLQIQREGNPEPSFYEALTLAKEGMTNYPQSTDIFIAYLRIIRIKTEWHHEPELLKMGLAKCQQVPDKLQKHPQLKAEYAALLSLSKSTKNHKTAKTLFEEAFQQNKFLQHEYNAYRSR